MNHREMLSSGFAQLVQALPRLVGRGRLGARLADGVAAPPPAEALSFPQQTQKPASSGQKPLKED